VNVMHVGVDIESFDLLLCFNNRRAWSDDPARGVTK
jgi:hypothetical protein